MPGLASGAYPFVPWPSGLVNRDFGAITPDGQVYGFESLTGRGHSPSPIVLVKLDGPETLRLEARQAATCGAGPWTLGNAAPTFYR